MVWISSPADWHCRHQKARPKMRTIAKWIKMAIQFNLLVMIFGLPGLFWNVAEIKETIQECKMNHHNVHLCRFGLQYDKAPSGSYFKLATNATGSFPGKCNCRETPRQHVGDWFGREEERADWRQKVWHTMVGNVFSAVRTCNITDVERPPSSICTDGAYHHSALTFPTDARVQLKKGLPRRRNKDSSRRRRSKWWNLVTMIVETISVA